MNAACEGQGEGKGKGSGQWAGGWLYLRGQLSWSGGPGDKIGREDDRGDQRVGGQQSTGEGGGEGEGATRPVGVGESTTRRGAVLSIVGVDVPSR